MALGSLTVVFLILFNLIHEFQGIASKKQELRVFDENQSFNNQISFAGRILRFS